MPTARLKIRVRSHSDALHRVMCVCHRRTVEIVALNFTGETIELAIAGSDRQLDGIGRWLSALPDVLGVHLRPSKPPLSRGREAARRPSSFDDPQLDLQTVTPPSTSARLQDQPDEIFHSPA